MGEAYQGETRLGVTKIALLPMTVVRLKSQDRDGYLALQVEFDGHKREIAFEDKEAKAVINPADVVAVGQTCQITGVSKGKGRAGVVKKWGFAGGPRTHGQSDRLRRAGSIGQGTTPGRVYKGKHMSGRMGGVQVSVKNSTVVAFDPASNIAMVKGAVPGTIGSLIKLTIN